MHRSLLPAVLSLSLLLSTFVAAQDASYTFTPVDVLFSGTTATVADGINTSGQIVGGYSDSRGAHGFLYAAGVFTPLDVPGANGGTLAFGINNHGQIVGLYSINDPSNETHGFLYDEGVFTPLDVPFSGASETVARGINDVGQIVGVYSDSSGQHGFLDDQGVFTPLDMPGARTGSTIALDLNNNSQIVGLYSDHTPQSEGGPRAHGFLYVNGVFTSLPDVPFPGAINTTATGINDRGQIVGNYNHLDGGDYGFLYDYDTGVFTPIDVPDSNGRTSLRGINNDGQIVGVYNTPSGGTHGFLATPVDKTPPMITIAASPETLSPPNGKLIPVTVSGMITDGSEGSGVSSAAYQVIDEYGQNQPTGSVIPGAAGSYAFTVKLQASRNGNDRDGRQYTIAVSATDQAGNSGVVTATVTVPRK